MRTPPPPGSKRVADWNGRKVKLREKIANGYGSWPAGTPATVVDAGSGLHLQFERCKCCGFHGHVRRVHPSAVELVA